MTLVPGWKVLLLGGWGQSYPELFPCFDLFYKCQHMSLKTVNIRLQKKTLLLVCFNAAFYPGSHLYLREMYN